MALVAATPQIRVRPLVESRPPDVTWLRPDPPEARSAQPRLDLVEPTAPDPAVPPVSWVRATVLKAQWTARPRPGLPDAAEWSATLALAVMQAVLAQRPIAQLNRWLADDVLAEVSRLQRRRRGTGDRAIIPVALRSVRAQHPDPDVAEVSAHLLIGSRNEAIALRLEATGPGVTGSRWLCTVLEFGPRLRP